MKKKAVTAIVMMVAIVALLASCTSGVSEEDFNRVVQERDQALSRVTSLESELSTTRSQMTDLEGLVAILQEQIAVLYQKIAEDFVMNSPTFVFDGMEESLELVETLYSEVENSWQFVYEFESRQAGYGDRTGQVLLQVITPHQAVITVEDGQVVSAIMDEKWDMINQQMLAGAITEEQARQIAEDFVMNSPTFVFDGMEESLELVETLYSEVENSWQFVFEFESLHAGYGDRTGMVLAQVITPHQAIITVEDGLVVTAIMDEKWNMLTQSMTDADLENVTWVLISYTGDMGTRQALEEVEVTLIFNSDQAQLGGSAGCNDYGAPYQISDSNLTITDNIIQTLKLCGEEIMEQENDYLQALSAAETYQVDGDHLTITGGGWILEFEKQQ